MMTLDEMKLAVSEKLPELIWIEHQEAKCFQSPFGDGLMDMPERWLLEWKILPEGRISGRINWPTEGLQVCHEATRLNFQFSIWTCDGGYGITLSNPPEHGNGQLVTLYGNNLLVIWLEALCRVWFPERFK